MTKQVVITSKQVRALGGSFLVNYEGVLTDELDRKKALRGSIAVSSEDAIPVGIRAEIRRKLGYDGFTISETPVPLRRPILGAAK